MEASKDTAVLLHCSGSSGAQWRWLQATLGARYQVLCPDLLGYGANAGWMPRGEFTLSHEAAPIVEMIKAAGGPVHLVGHSYGGAVALHIAHTRPHLIRSLTLIEPSAFHLLRGGDAIDTAAFAEITSVAARAQAALEQGDWLDGFGTFVDYWSGPGSWAAMPPEKRSAFARQLTKVTCDFQALFAEPAGPELMRRVGAPTLLVQGGCTKLPSRCVVHRLRAALPTAQWEVVQGAGHMLPITHRERVNALIAAHIDANAAALLEAAA
ncbi:MAG TPA: alpha/beta hydrolase [Burkholderiales bacterium]|nr:alpha/beta hydrolase [Burkholderiales bacterium]